MLKLERKLSIMRGTRDCDHWLDFLYVSLP
jgi:hypothetical protein